MTTKNLDIVLAEKNKSLKAAFIASWDNSQLKAMQKKITDHFNGKRFEGREQVFAPSYRTFKYLSEIFGLAYTSSSSYAGYWICNDEISVLKYPGFKYIGFAMNETGEGFAILWDKDENEIIIPL